ncbi:MAG: YggS family pyridoxal phosphate-dependent enzyme [Planctomycetota bacterium]
MSDRTSETGRGTAAEVGAEPTLDSRYASVVSRVAAAADRAGQDASRVHLIAVTKYAEVEDIKRLVELGHRDFGENRVQQLTQRAAMIDEWVKRRQTLPAVAGDGPIPDPPRWHMIGTLQRNKAKQVAECSRLIHSVDSMRLAEELQSVGLKREQRLDVLIQVNVSGEDSKFGCPVPAAEPLAAAMESMAYLRVRGLMTMAPYSEDAENARPHFARLRDVFEDMSKLGFGDGAFNLLSMGMSGDFEVGIEEGANLVRVGSAIFGERAAPAEG